MTQRKSRTDRGRQTEILAWKKWKTVYPQCRVVASSLPGRDLLETGPFAVEVKARSQFNPGAWIRQASRNSQGDIPLVVMRPNGLGPEQVGQWLVFMYQDDFLGLVKRAGLGGIQRTPRRSPTKQPVESTPPGGGERVDGLHIPSNEDVEGAVHTLLSLLGVEGWQVQVRRSASRDSEGGLLREADAA